MINAAERSHAQQMPRGELAQHQLRKLNELLRRILPDNAFYARKFGALELPIKDWDAFRALPMTTKEDLTVAGSGCNRTFPPELYVRYHQTSGTHGRPLGVYDTAKDWQWWVECWQYVLDAAGVTDQDRALLAFSFGPFVGFWSAFDALLARGALVIPSGGMSTLARLEVLERTGANLLFCTPTYALHLAETAAERNISLPRLGIKSIVVAGEPGGSMPAVRKRIETAWEATVIDHAGASEVGPWGFGTPNGTGLHVLETEFIAEFLSISTGQAAQAGELSQLVLTSLGRAGSPLIRYRTGDLVRPSWPQGGLPGFVFLEGGVLSRADDMLVVRGVNIYPTAIEQILHSFPEVVEYRMTARKRGEMDELVIEVEDHLHKPERIASELLLRLGLKVDVRLASPMSLPRFEGKGRRFIDQRFSR